MTDLEFWITPIGKSLGKGVIQTAQLFEKFGPVLPEKVEKVGFTTVYRHVEPDTLTGLASSAVSNESLSWLRDNCDALVFVSSSDSSVTPGAGNFVHSQLGLSASCQVLSVNDACTGFQRALDIASSLVSSGLATNILVLTADVYSHFFDDANIAVSTLFSDGAASVLVSKTRPQIDTALAPKLLRAVSRKRITRTDLAEILRIQITANEDDPKNGLVMQGGSVYSFVMTHAAEVITAIRGPVEETRQHWVLHQGSRLVVDSVSSLLGENGSDLFRAAHYGNVVGSSLPFQFFDIWDDVHESDSLCLLSFGVGMSIAGATYEVMGL